MVALLETKMVDNATLCDEFNFTAMIEIPAQSVQGRFGGIVILCFDNIVNIFAASHS